MNLEVEKLPWWCIPQSGTRTDPKVDIYKRLQHTASLLLTLSRKFASCTMCSLTSVSLFPKSSNCKTKKLSITKGRDKDNSHKKEQNLFAGLNLPEDANQDSNIFTAIAQQLNIPKTTAKAVFTTCFPYTTRFLADRTSPCLTAYSFSEEDCIAHIYPLLG